ncbi:MAG TPA: DUF4112 domain-containing protein [Thermoanaerobaculia bacterium]|nr:DUF4112 domain-containing protein [Thermoanaerobaculia bacterium]
MAHQSPIIPEVIEPDEKLPRDLVAMRKFAYLMDEAIRIPGTGRGIGLDAALGFIPGIGDIIGAVLSAWIIIGGLRHRVPMRYVVRMIVNVLLDMAIGEIPIVGDIFDIAFEENLMNMRLLIAHRDRGRPPRSFSTIAFTAILIIVLIASVGVAFIVLLLAAAVWIANQR